MGEDIPTVVSSGTVRIGAMEVTVHQLSNGQRVIDAADMEALVALLVERYPCPECDGCGWVIGVGVELEDRCCGMSDWECGGRGCTGPRQEQVQVQVQELCERCHGAGEVARDTDGSPEGPDPKGLDGEAATAGAEGIAQSKDHR
jgi:hypothetical protein